MVCEPGGISGLHIVDKMLVGLVMQGKPDGYSVINIIEDSFTKEGKVAGKDIFEGGFKFEDSKGKEEV